MNPQVKGILETFLRMSVALNAELVRLGRTEQFNAQPECLQLIENLRSSYLEGLQNLRTIEHRIMASGLRPPPDA